MVKALWIVCLFAAGCASVSGGPGGGASGEQEYLEMVQRGEEPGEVAYLIEERTLFRVAAASGDLGSESTEYKVMVAVDKAAQDSLKEMVRPWVVDQVDKYSRFFTWSERRPDSEFVDKQCEYLAQSSIKVWDRHYHQIKKYQSVHAVHRLEVEINILSEALPRDYKEGGSEMRSLLNRMEQLQSSYAVVSQQLEQMRQR